MHNARSDQLEQSPEVDIDMEKVIAIAHTAGEVLMKHYHTKYEVERKANQSPVTIADKEANELICKALQEISTSPILSEESKDDPSRLSSDLIWCVDPMDGTKDFIKKTGDFCVMIGAAFRGKPIAGVVYLPTTGETFSAQKGKGAFVKKEDGAPVRLQVARPKKLEDLCILLSRTSVSPFDHEVMRLLGLSKQKPAGSVGVKVARIAEGQADLYVINNRDAQECDTCAPEVILTEAGGEITDLFGQSLAYNQPDITRPNGFIASNGTFQKEMVQKLCHLVTQLTDV